MASDPLLIRAGATIRNYMKGAEDALSRRRIVPAMLRKKGNLLKNQGGDNFSWQVEFRQATAAVNNGAQAIAPTPVDRWRQPTLAYEGLAVSDRISKREYLANKENKSQLINIFSKIGKCIVRDIGDTFAEQFYVDGPANSGQFSGLQSFTAYTQTLQIDASTPTGRTANAADPLGNPDDSYAGFATDLGGVAGTWSGDYSKGTGSPEFDFWSPIIIRTQSTEFGGSSWQNNCIEALHFGIMLNLRQRPKGGGILGTVLLDNSMWFEAIVRLDAKERVLVSESLGLKDYGQDQDQGVFMVDGVPVTWEYGVPTARGFGINWDSVEFRSCQSDIAVLDMDSPKWVDTERSWHWIADILGQFKFTTPRNFVYFDNNY